MKSDKDVLQQKYRTCKSNWQNSDFNRTDMFEPTKLWANRCSTLGRNDSQLELEEHQLQLLIEQGEAQVQTVDVGELANQLTQAQAKKTDLEQGVIRKRFERMDLEGQAEDVAEQMEQARKKNEEWIRQQAQGWSDTWKNMRIVWTSS